MSNLSKYQLTEFGKKHLPKEGNADPRGKRIVIAANDKDPYFACYAGQMTDYHADTLYNRKDGRGKRYVRLVKESPKSAVPTVQKK